MIELLPEASPAALVGALQEQELKLRDIVGRGDSASKTRTEYLAWVANTERRLRHFIPPSAMARLVTTARYHLVHASVPEAAGRSLRALLDVELEERGQVFAEAATAVDSEFDSWGRGRAQVGFLDTSVLVHNFDHLLDRPWGSLLGDEDLPVVLAITMKVVDELDNLKDRGSKEVQAKARAALRWIEGSIKRPARSVVLRAPAFLHDEPGLWLKVVVDDLDHRPLPVADAEIVGRALAMSAFAHSVSVVTNDTGMMLRARAAGLNATRLADHPI